MKKLTWYAFNKDSVLINVGFFAGIGVFGIFLYYLLEFVVNAEEEHSFFPIAGLCLIMASVIFTLLIGWQEESMKFNLAISMGDTRKHFFFSFAVESFLLNLLDWCLIFIGTKAEEALAGALYPELPKEITLGGIFPWWTFFVVPFALTGVKLFMGGIGLKMGMNARWVMLVIWFALLIGMEHLMNSDPYWVLDVPHFVWILLILAIGAVGTAIGGLLLRRQMVNI